MSEIVESTAVASGVEVERKTVLVLRTCNKDMCGHAGFKWPDSGPVEAPTEWWGAGRKPSDLVLGWVPNRECGGGLHGLLWGEGNGNLLDWGANAHWLVVEVNADEVEPSAEKCRFPRGVVVHCGAPGDRASAIEYILDHGARELGKVVVGATFTAGYRGTATAGDRGTATAGDRGTATAGDSGTATAGDSGTATAGDSGTATAGYRGTATAGDRGTATAGDRGTATAGYRGTATAGDRGTATAGDSGTATAGYRGTATAGYRGTATAGNFGVAVAGFYGDDGQVASGVGGLLVLRWWDDDAERVRYVTGVVGEDGIKPNTWYTLDDDHKLKELGPVEDGAKEGESNG